MAWLEEGLLFKSMEGDMTGFVGAALKVIPSPVQKPERDPVCFCKPWSRAAKA